MEINVIKESEMGNWEEHINVEEWGEPLKGFSKEAILMLLKCFLKNALGKYKY